MDEVFWQNPAPPVQPAQTLLATLVADELPGVVSLVATIAVTLTPTTGSGTISAVTGAGGINQHRST